MAKEIFLTGNDEAGVEVHDYIKRRIRDCGHRVAVRHMDIGREGIMTLVGLGIGVSLVAENWRGVSYPGVVFIPFGEEAERLPFSLTWRQENDNPALRRFISLARIEAKRAAVAFEPS